MGWSVRSVEFRALQINISTPIYIQVGERRIGSGRGLVGGTLPIRIGLGSDCVRGTAPQFTRKQNHNIYFDKI